MWIGMPARMRVVNKDPLLPILEITLASLIPMKEILLGAIIDLIEIANEFEGEVLEKESNPELLNSEVFGISTTVIFSSVEKMLEFGKQILPPPPQ